MHSLIITHWMKYVDNILQRFNTHTYNNSQSGGMSKEQYNTFVPERNTIKIGNEATKEIEQSIIEVSQAIEVKSNELATYEAKVQDNEILVKQTIDRFTIGSIDKATFDLNIKELKRVKTDLTMKTDIDIETQLLNSLEEQKINLELQLTDAKSKATDEILSNKFSEIKKLLPTLTAASIKLESELFQAIQILSDVGRITTNGLHINHILFDRVEIVTENLDEFLVRLTSFLTDK